SPGTEGAAGTAALGRSEQLPVGYPAGNPCRTGSKRPGAPGQCLPAGSRQCAGVLANQAGPGTRPERPGHRRARTSGNPAGAAAAGQRPALPARCHSSLGYPVFMTSLQQYHRPLGSTGLTVSPLGLGTVKIGRNQGVKYPSGFELPTDQQVRGLLAQARDLGINLLDTAPAYGLSEQRLGPLLQGQRQEWVLCS